MSFECSNCHEVFPAFSMKCEKCEQMFTLRQMNSYHRISGTEKPVPLSEVKMDSHNRIKGLPEFDRIIGGGLIAGSSVLIGGEPGIGKSTLIIQECGVIKNVLYVSAEESIYQTKLRSERLGIKNDIKIVSEPNVTTICRYIKELKVDVAVVDSIQAVYTDNVQSSPGSANQVKESASELVDFCRWSNVALIMVGHIIKDGSIAGPKSMEHLVDTVLYFEGDRMMQYRVLRCIKNRFGATDETATFKMTKSGLKEIEDSLEFISTIPTNEIGTAVCPVIIGNRPFLIEIQSLISRSGAGVPLRRINGVDINRVNMIIAIMERTMGLSLYSFDIYINVVGGIKIDEPAADLSIAMSLLSSLKNKPLPKLAFIGEIGLTGEIRPVSNIEIRIKEAGRLGFKIAMPDNNKSTHQYIGVQDKISKTDNIITLSRLADVLDDEG